MNILTRTVDVLVTGLCVTDILPVGAYGVQFVFNDGHDRGIFPWVFLRELLERAVSLRAVP